MADNEVDPKLAEELKKIEDNPTKEPEKIIATKATGHTFTVPFYKKHKKILAIIGVIVVVLILSLIFIKPSQYKTSYVTNGGVKFSFSFSKTAQPVTVSGQNALLGWDLPKNNKLVVIPNVSSFNSDCGVKSSGLKVVFKTSIYGNTASTCTFASKVTSVNPYVTTFQKGGKWYVLQITSNDKTKPIDNSTAKTIVSSVKVQ